MGNELAFTNHKEYAPLPKKIGKEAEGQQQAKAAENNVASGPARNNGLQWEKTTEAKGKKSEVQLSYQDTCVLGPTTITVADSVKALRAPEASASVVDSIKKGINKRLSETYEKGCELSYSHNRLQCSVGEGMKMVSSTFLPNEIKQSIREKVEDKLRLQNMTSIAQCSYDGVQLQVMG
jgi:hypothetical protein